MPLVKTLLLGPVYTGQKNDDWGVYNRLSRGVSPQRHEQDHAVPVRGRNVCMVLSSSSDIYFASRGG